MKKTDNSCWKRVFQREAEKSGILLKKEEVYLFEKYLFLIEEWNKKINITAIKTWEEVAIKHFLDSLFVLKQVSLSGKIADIGSGGGFPGIPLKIVKPSLDLTLIEPIRKRASFLSTVISGLKLKKISVYNGRAEAFLEKEAFDFTISRALSDLKTFCSLSFPLLKKGGLLVAMKGKETASEEAELKKAEINIKIIEKKELELPQKYGSRSIIILQKCFT